MRTMRPRRPVPTSSSFPSSRLRGIRPRISSCARPSSPVPRKRSKRSRRGPISAPPSSGSRNAPAICTTQRRCARWAAFRACTASSTFRTTRCSTSVGISRRGPKPARCSKSAACTWACRFARTPGLPTARCAHRPRRGRPSRQPQCVAVLRATIARARSDARGRAAELTKPVVYTNLVGGQDELVFDGASLVFDEHGLLVAPLSSSPTTC